MFFENDDESYTMVDPYLDNNRFFGYKDSYNYDIDVNNILLFLKIIMNILLDIMM